MSVMSVLDDIADKILKGISTGFDLLFRLSILVFKLIIFQDY